MRTIPGLPQDTERNARTGLGTEKCRTIFCRGLQRKRTPPRKHRHVKKVAEELSLLGGILGGFFSLYSSFAEQCACYPYIFPTIFPRAAAGRSLHSRLRNLYCAPAT